MKIRFLVVLLLAVGLTGWLAPPSSLAEEMSLAQKEELLDRARDTLLWFRSLDERTKDRMAPQVYRDKITPIELLQVADLLASFRQEELNDLATHLIFMLPAYRLTPEEFFEIDDVLGRTALIELSGVGSPFIETIPIEAEKFRKQGLNSSERVVLYEEPKTALELMKVVEVLSVTGRPVLVRHYLRKFLNDAPFAASPEQSAKIVETIGTQKLMQIAINLDFVPLGKEAVTKLIDEAKKHWQDDARIAEALKETEWFREPATVSPQIRPEARPAMQILWKGDHLSVQQAFQKLATIEDEGEADQLTAVILSLRPDMKEALAVALGSSNSKLRYHAARGLAVSVTQQESFLLYCVLFSDAVADAEREVVRNLLRQRRITIPSQEQAAAILFERATDYFEHRRPLRIDTDGNVSSWTWERDHTFRNSVSEPTVEERIVLAAIDIEAAYTYFAARYYGQSSGILPKTSANRNAYIFAHKIAVIELQRASPIPIDWSGFIDPTEAEQFLQASLEKSRFHAASVAIGVLSKEGNTDLLSSTNGKPRPLVQATIAKNRAVRFAALETIMAINPTEPFAGSSLVTETLVWFSKSEGQSVVLSGHPQRAVANQTASLFLGLGYTTDVANTCRELFERAAASPDVELIVVDARTPLPPVGEFVQRMQQDARTAEIPIAILSNNERDFNPTITAPRRNVMTRFDRRNPESPLRTSLSLVYPHLASEESARWVRDDLLDKTGQETADDRRQTAVEERLEMAKQALRWLREIKIAERESGQKTYHFVDVDAVVLEALHSERRVSEGLQLAAEVRSPVIQMAIYELAANSIYPMRLREQASKTFEQSIETFGVLLRGPQIQRLYDRYNQSEHESKTSQELLSRLIDVVKEKVSEK